VMWDIVFNILLERNRERGEGTRG